ncbi:zinc finger protein 845-like [Condylostylus longicornis]|uniref:zinc finger protein 845-like n=1 Tax=Condylostylus longicornis TaxID=2530218 RepID=UPI00244E18A4|nr:zinc finger protein 845-like [Condylostylus longicornis]
MTKDWKCWCRLCGRENGSEIDVFIKNENATTIAEAIQSYFSVSILDTDIIPIKICNVCNDIVIGLINFTIRSSRVQQLFNELQFHQNVEIVDINELRNKYGLTNQTNDLKFLKGSQNFEKHDDMIKINEVPEGSFLDENIGGFFKCENNSNFSAEHDDNSSNLSEDEKPLLKLKTKKGALHKHILKRRKIKVLPENFVESNLSEHSSGNDSENSLNSNTSEKDILNECNNKNEPDSLCVPKKMRRRNVSPVVCEICNKSFISIGKYNYHKRTKHNTAKKNESVVCKTCGKTFKKQSKLEDHENVHLPPEKQKLYSCPQCDKKFPIQASIQLHIKTVHMREKTLICEECGKIFATIAELNSHKVVHSDFTPFQCPKCPKTFKRLISLRTHIDCHDDTKYTCPICACQLNTKTILRRHMVIHSDEKKYKCNFCQKGFKRTKALKNHLILHTGLKPYECPFCDQTFAQGSNCRKHQKNSHPAELAAMESSGEKKACKNVPPLEHLKAVNNAAIVNSNDNIITKIENVTNENVTKFYLNNYLNYWRSWCRLCARENGSEIDVFIKNENATTIADAIQNYFSVSILETDIMPIKICNVCYDIVIELINFTIRSSRVQQLFNELQFHQNVEIVDVNELRNKYGLTNQNYDLKCLKDSQTCEKQEDVIKINEVPEGSFLDENIGGFFKCDNISNFSVENDDDSSNVSSEDEKPLLKLKIKREVLDRHRLRRRKINVLPEDFVESKLSEQSSENDSEDSLNSSTFEKDTLNECDNVKSETDSVCLPKKMRRRNDSPVVCGICSKSFNSRGKYNYHKKTKHNTAKKSESVACKTCGKTFKKQSRLEDHENMHLPPEKRKLYSCPQCDKKFAVQASIQLHIKTVHIREKTFICEECGKVFATSDQLNSHKVVHSDFTPFQCPKCPKSFKRLTSLRTHIDCHEDTKYICPICGCQLNTKTILRRHMVIHSDEKKYKCNFCQKEFKRTKALKNHLILHTGLKPYECPFCDQTFANGSNSRKHQKNSHPAELAAMERSGEKRACKNVPPLEHLKAVNNAAIINPHDSIITKIENVTNENVTKFCLSTSIEANLDTASTFDTQSRNQLTLDSNLCDNLNFAIHPKIELKEKNDAQTENCIEPQISPKF